MRLDIAMTERGLVQSRSRAKELIASGKVRLNGAVCTKPSAPTGDGDTLEIIGETLAYVGRGGLKLEKIMKKHSVDLSGAVCMDVGASTGGFTDCMLQNGAKKVYAVDVGSGQLAQSLVCDERVVNMEKTDIRTLDKSTVSEDMDFISADVSFISLRLVLPHIYRLLSEGGRAVVLIKPQFEAGKANIGKNGVVKSKKAHEEVLHDIYSLAEGIGFFVRDLCFSPVTGAKGNIEYLMYMDRSVCKSAETFDFKNIVSDAFENLKNGGK